MTSNPNFPIGTASVSWLDGGGSVHIRVYSTDGNTVTERCWDDNSWTTGGFSAPGGAVSATVWSGGGAATIRVYCTYEDKTTEFCSDQGGAWYEGGYTVV